MHSIELQRFKITDECLEKLSVDQRAMFAILCLTVSEVDAMRKALSLGPQVSVGDEQLDTALISQRMVFLRIIGMKIFEAFKTLMLVGKYNKTQDVGLREFKDNIVRKEHDQLTHLDGFELARRQRDKLGFHYDLDEFRKLVAREGTNVAHAALVAEQFEFQSFPFGEIALVSGLGDTSEVYSEVEARACYDEFAEFTTQAMRRFSSIFNAFFETFLNAHLKLEEIEKAVPDTLVATRNETSFPLFLLPEVPQ